MLRRALSAVSLAVLAAALPACSEADPYPPTGSLQLALIDTGVASQSLSAGGTSQLTRWTLGSARAFVNPEGREVTFVGAPPCVFAQAAASQPEVSTACGGSGLVVGVQGARAVELTLEILAIERRQAWRPDLFPDGTIDSSGDYDGDGVPNGTDNCMLVPNPGQQDVNTDGTGDACSALDATTGRPEIPDQDLDQISDFSDNCVWRFNPTQKDLDESGIGDDCEKVLDARPAGASYPVNLKFRIAPVAILPGRVTYIKIESDFECSASGVCTFDPSGFRASASRTL